jgi:hypothetical protein
MPPVSVTMQPRNLADVAAAVPDELLVGVLDVLVPDDAELWLLPHAAMTSVADTASAAVAHALCFTLTSTWASALQRLASPTSWVVPQAMPGDARCEGDTRPSGLLVAESEPDHDEIPGRKDRYPRLAAGVLVRSYMLSTFRVGEEV